MSNSVLFQPFKLHDLTLPNRIVLAPMTRSRAGTDRLPNQLMAEYCGQRSESPDFREQFTFVAEQLDHFGLAYLHVMDGLAFGFHKLGEPMTLAEFRKVFHGPLMGNCGYTQELAEKAITDGNADLIAFGRPFISNPDLVQRFKNGWPLAAPAPMSDWYSPSIEPSKIAVHNDPRIVRMPALSENLLWNTQRRPVPPPNSVSGATGIKMMILKMYGNNSRFMFDQPFHPQQSEQP